MLLNGLYFIADQAASRCREPLVRRYRQSLILGSLREDVIRVPLVGFTEYPSFSHFGGNGLPGGYLPLVWPGPRRVARRRFARALRRADSGELAASFVELGRLLHVLSDMSIPSHAHRAAHERDPFEWWVEGNLRALSQSAVADVPRCERPEQLVQSLSRRAAEHAPDRTQTPLGRLLRRAGVYRRVDATLARRQALELVPLAVSHARALLELACSAIEQRGQHGAALLASLDMRDEKDVLDETLAALDLPDHMLGPWLAHNRAFCEKHGGRRVYAGLLELLDRCDAALARKEKP